MPVQPPGVRTGAWTRPAFLANKASSVSIGGGAFSFRNPPRFNSLTNPTARDAAHEVKALLNYLDCLYIHACMHARLLVTHLLTYCPIRFT